MVATTTSRVAYALPGAAGSSLASRLWHNRHVIGFAICNFWRPRAILAARGAHDDAIRAQQALFRVARSDDVGDAYRHAYASALLTYDLHHRLGMPLERAQRFTRKLGQAHEADSPLRGAARRNSSAMDLHNNDLGISFVQGRSAALSDATLGAIGEGKAWVLDSRLQPPRASTREELNAALRNPPAA